MALILLVDDDEMIGRMISLRLRVRGHSVEFAHNGQEGIDKALTGKYDLVLMDMHMPVMDGHEAVRRLREQSFGGTIVAVTASAMSEDSQAAIEAGCNHFVTKPISDDFEQRIEDFMAAG